MEIQQIVEQQRQFFAGGLPKNLAFRRGALRRLHREISQNADVYTEALRQDLGRAPAESYMCEVGLALDEIRYLTRHFAAWAADEPVKTPLMHFPSRSFVKKEPYGVALIMAPWNYPFLLSIEPLAGAIAAGNCVVLKPSAYAPATSAALAALVKKCFHPGHVTVVEGGRAENNALLDQRFDTILFTGSVEVGKLVMEKAAKNLTPVTLELGGKSPCIVDKTADLPVAARRIAFGKWLNTGQTCVAPDYVLVHRSLQQPLLQELEEATRDFFGPDALRSPELPRIVNDKHFKRLQGLLENQTIAFGGRDDGQSRIQPTVLRDVDPASAVMQEEIFGPILPVIPVDSLQEAITFVNGREKPLALYLFTESGAAMRRVLRDCAFGGGCVNDTIVHLATSHMPFGGVGHSGMGGYHGKASFDTFTHKKSILQKSTRLDLPVRYHPYTSWKDAIVHALLR